MGRTVYPINRNWLYGERFSAAAVEAYCNEKGWERVTIPHTNKRLPWHSFDEKLYQFVCVYRRHFRLPRKHRSQRVFVDFAGVMTAAVVYLNGKRLGEHKGGYTPFSFELTDHVNWQGDNVLAVKVDARERADIPPFGGHIDYLTFGGIYREVQLRVVAATHIDNVFARPRDVLKKKRCVDVRYCLAGDDTEGLTVRATLRDGRKVLAQGEVDVEAAAGTVCLKNLGEVTLWDLDNPKLYGVTVQLRRGGAVVDEYAVRIGLREAAFTPKGFMLNGRHVKLRGLNRHQTFPYVGQAMPARVQRRDALILKQELKCNVVRTSHYPQSVAFLDCCDEIGLLVFEEIPGWQHIGNKAWQDVACANVREMIERDWNHPSIILWGVRINESPDNDAFYARTNAIAHELDDSRQTGGVRCIADSRLLEDVFTINDFHPDKLRKPSHPLYFNTEFCGHMYSTKHADNVERVVEHGLRHARVHNMLGADRRYAGGTGWCAFDYNTHHEFGSGDRICYHGVSDIFRIPKLAAGFYKAQCDPAEEIVLEPGFTWSWGDQPRAGGVRNAVVWSNCDTLKFYFGKTLVATEKPDRKNYPHVPHPPFVCGKLVGGWGEAVMGVRIDGYIKGKKVISRRLSSRGVDAKLVAALDDKTLQADGIDATRLAFGVTDEYGNARPFATGAIVIDVTGPAEIIGENPFALAGGCGAVWVRATERAGKVTVKLTHPVLGTQTLNLRTTATPKERV